MQMKTGGYFKKYAHSFIFPRRTGRKEITCSKQISPIFLNSYSPLIVVDQSNREKILNYAELLNAMCD
ncbi:unnamed protein product [Paramecium pentaurelia]|uniref:Uncharacterized protein n=1 Tax=Paramecium pentaurelia TaxID=43138 RepID=A0A8S1YJB5_9CILI|nr:unnamed protein product [Paramecium pentaurelia]